MQFCVICSLNYNISINTFEVDPHSKYNWADTPIFLQGVPLLSMKIRNIVQSIPHSQLQILIRPGNQVVLHALDKGFG